MVLSLQWVKNMNKRYKDINLKRAEKELHDARNCLKMSSDPRKVAYWSSQVTKFAQLVQQIQGSEPDDNVKPANITPPDNLGRKDDKTKRRLSLIPIKCLNSIVDVLEYGVKKYGLGNWKHVPDANTRYFDAAIRHLFAWRDGEKLDPETNLPHLAHAACCVIFALWFDLSEEKSNDKTNV